MTPTDTRPSPWLAHPGLDLGKLRVALAVLPWSDYYTRLDDYCFSYRATTPAIATFGHVQIACAMAQLSRTVDVRAQPIHLDRIPLVGYAEPLFLLRHDDEPAVHALTESELQGAIESVIL